MSEAIQDGHPWWVMLMVSLAVHGVLGLAVQQAASQVEFEDPKSGRTSVSVLLIAATAAPKEPSAVVPADLDEVRRPLFDHLAERILTRDEIPIERTPYSLTQVEKAKVPEEKPQVRAPRPARIKPVLRQPIGEERPAPVQEVKNQPTATVATPSEPLPLAPNSDRTLASASSSGSEHVAVEFRTRVEPRYPRELWMRQIAGDVELLATLAVDGHVMAAKVFKTSGYAAFDNAALEAVRQWRARPTARAGSGATQDVIVPISFRIRR